MRSHPRSAHVTPGAALAAAALVSVPAVVLPLWVGGILVSLTDVAVGAAFAASAVLLSRSDHLRASVSLAAAAGMWTLVGLAPLLPPSLESAVSRGALVPHALVIAALTSVHTGTGRRLLRGTAGAGLTWTAVIWRWGGLLPAVVAIAAGAGLLPRPLLAMGLGAVAVGGVRLYSAQTRADKALGALALVLGGCWIGVEALRLSVGLPAVAAAGIVDVSLIVVACGITLANRRGDLWRAMADGQLPGSGKTLLAHRLGAALETGPVEVWFEYEGRIIDSEGQPSTPVAWWPFTDKEGRVVGLIGRQLPDSPMVRRELAQVLDRAGRIAVLRAQQRALSEVIERSRTDLLRAADRERAELEVQLRSTALSRLDAIAALLPRDADDELRVRVAAVKEDLVSLARGLDPLGGLSLSEGLVRLVSRTPGAKVGRLDITGLVDSTPARTVWYSCAEALANAVKHCPGVDVIVDAAADAEDPTWIVLRVRDNGSGGADSSGRGLRGLADRVAATGGRFSVADTGSGTEVVVRVRRSLPEKYASSPTPIGAGLDVGPRLRNLASAT